MFLRQLNYRRSFTTKLLLFSLVCVCFLFYLKVTTNNESTITTYNNRRVIAGKLVNQYSANDDVDTSAIDSDTARPIYPVDEERFKRFEPLILKDLAKQKPGLGDNGQEATLTDPEAREIGERQYSQIALNEELSEHLSYNRTLKDARNPLCRKKKFDLNGLPTASVVIIFFNEPFSVLVRTVHSVLNTCDRRVLREIILVDDCSTNVELKEKLDYYIETRLPRNVIKVIRLKHR